MKEFTLHAELLLPAPRDQVFAFFAAPANLETLTPPWLRFEILTPAPVQMRAGALIDYKIHLYGFPIKWRTEVTRWNPPHDFEDLQVRGPYTLWRHTHTFAVRGNATLCIDDVHYRPRGGAFVNWLFVRRDIERIFAFRKKRLLEIFACP